MNKVQKDYAINLADKINKGVLSVTDVVDIFECNKKAAIQITQFWLRFNSQTRKVLQDVITESNRRHLEKCFTLDIQDNAK